MKINIEKNEFDLKFSNAKYAEEDNVVFLIWKKFCSYDDYINPTTFAKSI